MKTSSARTVPPILPISACSSLCSAASVRFRLRLSEVRCRNARRSVACGHEPLRKRGHVQFSLGRGNLNHAKLPLLTQRLPEVGDDAQLCTRAQLERAIGGQLKRRYS